MSEFFVTAKPKREFCDLIVICTGIIRAYWRSFQRIAREFRKARARESGVAKPTAAIWAGAMTLEHLGAKDAAQLVMNALERALESGRSRTPDLGGSSSTVEMAEEVITMMRN